MRIVSLVEIIHLLCIYGFYVDFHIM